MYVVGKVACICPASVWSTWLQAVGSLLMPRDPRDCVQITGLIARTFPNGAILLVLLFRFFSVYDMCAYIDVHMGEGGQVWEMPHLAWGALLNCSNTLNLVH